MSLGKMTAEEKAEAKAAKAEAARIKREAAKLAREEAAAAAKAARARAPKTGDVTRAITLTENALKREKAKASPNPAKVAELEEKLERVKAGSGALRAPLKRVAVPKETTVGCKAAKGGFCFDLGDAQGESLLPFPASAAAVAAQTGASSATALKSASDNLPGMQQRLVEATVGGRPEKELKQIRRKIAQARQDVTSTRSFDYFANNLKDVCRVKKVAPKCFTPTTNDAEKPREMPAWGKNGKYPEAKTEEQKRKACDAVGGVFSDGGAMPLRLGKTELDFLSKAQARDIGKQFRASGGGANVPVRPGANLRLCFTGSSKGVMVPLRDPKSAVKVRDEFRDCLAGHGANPSDAQARACAIGVGRKATGIGKQQETALFGVRRKKARKSRRKARR
jgi:hypothetical protein